MRRCNAIWDSRMILTQTGSSTMSSTRTFSTSLAGATDTNTGSKKSRSALSSEAKVGIGIGAGLVIIIIIFIVLVMSGRHRWRRSAPDGEHEDEVAIENEAAKVVHTETALCEGSHLDDPPPSYDASNAEARRARIGVGELHIERA
jgi:hypothetical protein